MLNGYSSRDSLPRSASRKLACHKDDGEMYASLTGSGSGDLSDIFFAADQIFLWQR
jgi:hypothetical protein